MKITSIAFSTFLFAAGGASAATPDLMPQAQSLGGLFDSGLGFRSGTMIPAPFSEGRWGAAPRIESSGAKDGRMQYRDALDIEACHFIDAQYFRQPTLEEAAAALKSCLAAVAQKYRTTVAVSQNDKELVIVVSGILPAGSTVAADLRQALEMRQGRLFGHSARVVRLTATSRERKMSSLQFVVDRCPTTKMVHTIRSSGDFLGIYGGCIRQATGLEIMAVVAHPTESRSIVVYSKDQKDTIAEMNGVIQIPADNGPVRIQVSAFQEVLSSALVPAARR
ncbi:MAG: hypothetical protein ABIJ96_16130 [Elusimicrobiota bacterium]